MTKKELIQSIEEKEQVLNTIKILLADIKDNHLLKFNDDDVYVAHDTKRIMAEVEHLSKTLAYMKIRYIAGLRNDKDY